MFFAPAFGFDWFFEGFLRFSVVLIGLTKVVGLFARLLGFDWFCLGFIVFSLVLLGFTLVFFVFSGLD